MKASWNGRQVGDSTAASSLPCMGPKRRRAALAITRLAMRNANSASLSSRTSMPVLDALRRGAGPLKEGLGHLAALGGQRGQNLLLVGDPIPILLHERPERLLSGRAVGQLGEGFHRSSTFGDLGGSDALDLGRGNPARANGVAVPSASISAWVAMPWPTEYSKTSRYCRSATRSSHSSVAWPFRLGRGISGSAEWTVKPGLEDEPLVPVARQSPGCGD